MDGSDGCAAAARRPDRMVRLWMNRARTRLERNRVGRLVDASNRVLGSSARGSSTGYRPDSSDGRTRGDGPRWRSSQDRPIPIPGTSEAVPMKISSNALRAKRSCASGYRWFARRFKSPAEHQGVIDALVADGRVDDACWLLDQFGSIESVLVLDAISANAFVCARSAQVRGEVDVDSAVRAEVSSLADDCSAANADGNGHALNSRSQANCGHS